jgi:phosphoribosylanthranilate isomerase
MASIKTRAVQVKICGITNAEDARWVVNFGADYIGVNFCAESPRKVSPEKAAEIAAGLPSFVKTVGVFMNPDSGELGKILKKVHLHILQLHGDESVDRMLELKSEFKIPIWKALRVQNEDSLSAMKDWAGVVEAVVLDNYHPAAAGGTGESFDWELAAKAKSFGIPVFLAGGLKPDNVIAAIQQADPFGVDVASGVEKDGHPKKKDVNKLKAFIEKAKGLSK